ncbi:outer membrane beta-barrel protein [Desulfonatronovibrio hydrogenovorans]|uniref:outer membrane beta-barrel protein n=1 Tax=Desulfonatronovibrio hydrogenovorans TaxID=53245 RepID=UPI00048C3E9A|nr:outer membrane beta-barrel protein [Desulfonatronovibrio hydrogenovorans]
MQKRFVVPALVMLMAFFSQPVSAGALWTITPDANIQQQYNDNIFQARNDRRSDWITVIGAGLSLEALGKSQGMAMSYRPSYSMYHKYDEFDTLRHRADLEMWKNIQENLRVSFHNTLDRREQPYDPDDPDLEYEAGFFDEDDVRRSRKPRTINTARARMDYRFGPRDSAYVQYGLRNEWNDNVGEEDSAIHSPSAGVTYWFSRLYGVETAMGYDYGRYDESENRQNWDGRVRLMRNFTRFLDGYIQYRHSHIRYSGDRPGYSVYEPSLGVSYRFSQDGHMRVGLAYNFRDREGRSTDESFVLDADINQTWARKRSSFTLRGNSGYAENFRGTDNEGFTIFYHGSAVYSYALRKDLTWNVSGGYRRNMYKDRDPERRDNIYNLGTGISYMWTRQWSLGLDYDYRNVNSNIKAEEYYENRATLTLNWRPQPKRLN